MRKDRRVKNFLSLYLKYRWTLQEIGDRYGLTRERVRQLIAHDPEYMARVQKGKNGYSSCRTIWKCRGCRTMGIVSKSFAKNVAFCSWDCRDRYKYNKGRKSIHCFTGKRLKGLAFEPLRY